MVFFTSSFPVKSRDGLGLYFSSTDVARIFVGERGTLIGLVSF